MSGQRLPNPHHFINADGFCHAGDMFEAGTETTGVYLAEQVEQIVAARVAAFRAEAVAVIEELAEAQLGHIGPTSSLTSVQHHMGLALAHATDMDLIRNLNTT